MIAPLSHAALRTPCPRYSLSARSSLRIKSRGTEKASQVQPLRECRNPTPGFYNSFTSKICLNYRGTRKPSTTRRLIMYKRRVKPGLGAQPLEVTLLGQHQCTLSSPFLILPVRAVCLFPLTRFLPQNGKM
uniref:Uncharacterized protein n=1 Tax=Molossus molossus TaxID=27622 RepID=A0A7J8IZ99_MOLMO|nr:hypothetical protein HJG59_010321 [Molossus molossus]